MATVVVCVCFLHNFALSAVLIDYLTRLILKIQFMKTEAEPASETPYFKSLKMETVQRKYSLIVNTKNVQFLKGPIK